jgi:hypothetical protein
LNPVDDAIVKLWKAGDAVPKNLWTPIGDDDTLFAGVFDGQGHTISGLYLKSTVDGVGLFGNVDRTAELVDFKLVDSYMESSGLYFGGIVGYAYTGLTRMEKIYTDVVMKTSGSRVGGFVGAYGQTSGSASCYGFNMIMKDCWFDGEIIAAKVAH